MARTFILKIEGKEYEGDNLTLNEMIEVQELCGGIPFSDINYGDAVFLRAVAWVVRKRDDPEVTLETIGDIKGLELLAGEEPMPPLPPSGAGEEPNQNGSPTPDDSGALPSPASIPGSALSTSVS